MKLKSISTSVKEYFDTMQELAKERKDMPFDNSGAEHAVSVMSAMFNNASRGIDIYASSLDGSISNYSEYYESFIRA
ncbi:MAG: hypothetical protein IPK03_03390 [Bacteroidetes bacterium]|nr:hypothetical protein [Bacteroidota bacterium]